MIAVPVTPVMSLMTDLQIHLRQRLMHMANVYPGCFHQPSRMRHHRANRYYL